MPSKHWRIKRLHLYAGFCDTLAVKIEVDFIEGWGLSLQVANLYFVIVWWARVGR